MFFPTVTLRFHPASGSFDDGRFDEFAKSKELLAVKEHFFVHAGLPHLLLCVSWRMPPAGAARKPEGGEEWRVRIDACKHKPNGALIGQADRNALADYLALNAGKK